MVVVGTAGIVTGPEGIVGFGNTARGRIVPSVLGLDVLIDKCLLSPTSHTLQSW